jgi:hypothetical protein
VESVAPADDDVNSVYQYLIGAEGGNRMNALWMRQIAAVWRMEWKKTLLSKRGWWIYCLALDRFFLDWDALADRSAE